MNQAVSSSMSDPMPTTEAPTLVAATAAAAAVVRAFAAAVRGHPIFSEREKHRVVGAWRV